MYNRLRQNYIFLLAGFGSEYSLEPIARYLTDNGFSAVVADMQKRPLPRLPAKPTIFITSQHPSCSSAIFRHHWGQSPPYANYVGPLEIIRHLRPACSVFVPHDLEQPVRPDELAYMAAFDIYCAPSSRMNPTLRYACRVLCSGWVKHNHFDDLPHEIKALAEAKGVFFLNQVVTVMHAGGASFVRANYPAIFSEHLPVKLPLWPGSYGLEEELRQLGALVIAAETPSTKLIAASPLIYVNAPGSVIAEARYVGTPVILVGDSVHPDRTLFPSRPGAAMSTFDFDGLLAGMADHIEHTQ